MTDAPEQESRINENSLIPLGVAVTMLTALLGGAVAISWSASAMNEKLAVLNSGLASMQATAKRIEDKVDGTLERVGENVGRLRVLEDWRKQVDERLRGIK